MVVGPTAAAPAVGRGEIEAGEDAGEFGDVAVVVGRDRLAAGVELAAAIGVQFPQPDGEQLHDLSGEILIGIAVDRGIRLLVAGMAEIHAHRGMEGDIEQQVAVVAEGVADQGIVVVRHRLRFFFQLRVPAGDHEDLGQGEGDALTELVRCPDGVAGEGGGDVVPEEELVQIAVVVGRVDARSVGVRLDRPDVGGKEAGREGNLPVDPALVAKLTDLGDRSGDRAEGGLHQEAGGIHRRWRPRDAAAGAASGRCGSLHPVEQGDRVTGERLAVGADQRLAHRSGGAAGRAEDDFFRPVLDAIAIGVERGHRRAVKVLPRRQLRRRDGEIAPAGGNGRGRESGSRIPGVE